MNDQLPIPNSEITEETKQLLAEAAREKAVSEYNGTPFLSLRGKKFSSGDTKLGTELKCIILADVMDNAWYDRAYQEDVVTPPACFAIGFKRGELAPHPDSPDPQSETCLTCPQNEFGSANNGKGKACRNGRRLLITPFTEDGVFLDELAIINISPTALRNYSSYITRLKDIYRVPPYAVATQLSFDDDKAYPVLCFNTLSLVSNNNLISEILDKMEHFEELISVTYDVSTYTPPAEPAAARSKLS